MNDQEKIVFWSKVEKSEGCWNWTGSDNGLGYGRFWVNGKTYIAHRVSVILSGRKIPPNMVVDHTCRNRRCVNPGHLRVVTQAINAVENSVGMSAQNKAKLVCLRGHSLSGENLRINKKGARICITCSRESGKKYCQEFAEKYDNTCYGCGVKFKFHRPRKYCELKCYWKNTVSKQERVNGGRFKR